MKALIENTSKIAARFALIVVFFSLFTALFMALSGDTGIISQYSELLAHPMTMAGELIACLPVIKDIPLLENISTVYSAGNYVLSDTDPAQTVFMDLYFAVLSTLIIHPAIYFFRFLKGFVGNINNMIIEFITTQICIFVIAYFGAGMSIVISNWISLSIFKNNYVVAFFVMILVQLGFSSIKAFLGNKDKKNIFLNTAGTVFVDLLFSVSIFSCILHGNAIFFKGLFSIEFIVWLVFSLIGVIFSSALKRKNNV